MEGEYENRPLLPQESKMAAMAMALLFAYSIAMFTLPFAAFYGTKYTLLEYFEVDGFSNIVWSVVASVAMVHVIILSYAYQGYREKEYDDEGNEIDQSVYNPPPAQAIHPKED